MPITAVHASQDLSWDFENCVFRTFRVVGTCNSYDSPLQECPQLFVVNVPACNVGEVCAKLVSQNFRHTIQSIQYFNQLVNGTLIDPTKDPNYLTDVTPSLNNIDVLNSCAGLLINQDLSTLSGASAVAVGVTYSGPQSNQPATLLSAQAPQLQPVISLVALPTSCCTVTIPSLLGLKHNLGNVLSLQNFLLLNSFNLAGNNSVFSLGYEPRYNVWQGNAHYFGLATDGAQQQTWDIIFEFGCVNNYGGSALPASAWKFSVSLHRYDSVNGTAIARLTVLFNSLAVCSVSGPFSGFKFDFNINNLTTTPANNGTLVFSDEANLFLSSPFFINNPVLSFDVSLVGAQADMTYDFANELPRQAAGHVADKSGFPLQI